MSYQVLARKWRPNTFSELVGQEHVVAAITNALDNNRLHHAYLFTGTRGVGKTTIARIFAKSLNCEKGMGSNPCGVCPTCKEIEQGNYVDLLEIDAASRTKVEDTRELLDNVQYKPTRAQYKVYLIDEVHMLSKHSFNALLKTLEEPPPHVKFLLATTDPQKLPITILSRCLQFTLKALTREQIQRQLAHILEQEDLVAESAALHELARAAQGSMRDSLSLTDQAIAQGNGEVTAQVVADMLGLLDRNVVLKLLHAVLKKDKHQVLQIIDDLAVQAPDFGQLLGELMSYLHQIALTQFVPEACKLETHAARAVFTLAKSIPPEQVQMLYQIALQGRKDLPHAVEGRIGLEMTLLRMLAFVPENTMLQADEVVELFATLPKTSLTTLEQERKQTQNPQLSRASVDAEPVESVAETESDIQDGGKISAEQTTQHAAEVSSQPSSDTRAEEKKTQSDSVNEITDLVEVAANIIKDEQDEPAAEASGAIATDETSHEVLSEEAPSNQTPNQNSNQTPNQINTAPDSEIESADDSSAQEVQEAVIEEELNAEQNSLFEQAKTMRAESLGSNDGVDVPEVAVDADQPLCDPSLSEDSETSAAESEAEQSNIEAGEALQNDALQDGNQEASTQKQNDEAQFSVADSSESVADSSESIADTTESVADSSESIADTTESVADSSESIADTTESIADSSGNIVENVAESATDTQNNSQSLVQDDPQLADAYAQYLSAMPDEGEDYAEPDVFDPATLVAHPAQNTEQNTSDMTSADASQDDAASLVNTEELLALRTQIADNIQDASDNEKDVDEGSEAINRALKNNVPAAKTSVAESAPSPQADTSATQAERIADSTYSSKSDSNKSDSNAHLVSDDQSTPPWETTHTNNSVADDAPESQLPDAESQAQHSNAEYPVEYYQQFVSQSEQPDEPEQEPVFVDTRSGWLPGMDETETAPSETLSADATDFASQNAESDSAYEEVDFDIPYQLNDGKKVVKASQLDTWSQLIESMGLAGLTKQIAIHSMYKMNGDAVQLTLAQDKKHLVGPQTTAHLTEALTQALRHDVSVDLEYGEVTDTPFAVQQAINRMRMQHAHKTIAADQQVQLLCQTFNAEVISESIKPK